jgi:hypothetical protein
MRIMNLCGGVAAAALLAALTVARPIAQNPACDLGEYKAAPGLTASNGANGLALSWQGDGDRELRLTLTIESGTPTIGELAVRRKGGAWATIASRVTPEFRIVSGFRRMSNQQLQPLRGLNVEITPQIIDEKKWDAFWDAPLDLNPEAGRGRGGNPPPAAGIAGQPGLPRTPDEVTRAAARFHATGCAVKTDGARLEVSYPGVELGPFAGRLQLTIYKGTGLIRLETIAKTDRPSVAYKYDAGLKGLAIDAGARAAWRDLAGAWQSYRFGGNRNEQPVALKASNRLLIAERSPAGSLAVFPPPHSFFWARELATNLGYTWYRKDDERRSRSAFARPSAKNRSSIRRTSRSTARVPARGSGWRCTSMPLPTTRKRRPHRCSHSPTAIATSRCPAIR